MLFLAFFMTFYICQKSVTRVATRGPPGLLSSRVAITSHQYTITLYTSGHLQISWDVFAKKSWAFASLSLYHRECQRRGAGGQKKPKSCQRSLWTTPKLSNGQPSPKSRVIRRSCQKRRTDAIFFSQNKRPHAIYYSGLEKIQSADENEWFHYFFCRWKVFEKLEFWSKHNKSLEFFSLLLKYFKGKRMIFQIS